jgi:hypothetical protein
LGVICVCICHRRKTTDVFYPKNRDKTRVR